MNIPLGETQAVRWVDGSNSYYLDKLVLNGTIIWENIIEFTGTATYNPITKEVVYQISGDRISAFTKWSIQATRRPVSCIQTENQSSLDTEQADCLEIETISAETIGPEVFITDGSTSLSAVVGVDLDGTWDVTFKGYINDDVRGTALDILVIATPFIEITSVEEVSVEEVIPTAPEVRITGTARNMNETVVVTNPRGGGGTSTYTYSSPSAEEEFDITSQWPDGAGIIKSKTYYLQTRQAEFNTVANTNYASNLYLDVSGRIYTNQAANWRNIKVYIEGVLAYTQPDDLPVRGEVDYLNIDS